MLNKKNVKILCVTDFYLPGYKGGGPIRTIANMCAALAFEIDFYIYTRNHDLGESKPYEGIVSGAWSKVGDASIYYDSSSAFGASGLTMAAKGLDFDLIYLNSFFSWHGSISICLRKASVHLKDKQILLAPRGEFSAGALQQKLFKKKFFLLAAKLFGLYKDVYWHASTELEAEDIRRTLSIEREKIFVASDLVALSDADFLSLGEYRSQCINLLKLGFISRISPKKNLDGLLKILQKVKENVSLSIYGPIEDKNYWQTCQSIMNFMPSNVSVKYCGELPPSEVSKTFTKFDLFVFPTLGENFGHVIFEALRAGTPVVVSDQTPWQHQADGSITVLSLADDNAWMDAIAFAACRSFEEKIAVKKAAFSYAKKYLTESNEVAANLSMFTALAGKVSAN